MIGSHRFLLGTLISGLLGLLSYASGADQPVQSNRKPTTSVLPIEGPSLTAELEGISDYFGGNSVQESKSLLSVSPAKNRKPSGGLDFRPLAKPAALQVEPRIESTPKTSERNLTEARQKLSRLKIRANGLRARIAQAKKSEETMKNLTEKQPALSYALSSPFMTDYLSSENELFNVESEIVELEGFLNSR